jgi:hypothetical protein
MAIKRMTAELFDGSSTLTKLESIASKREVNTVLAHARSMGFVASTKASDVQGFKRSYLSDVEVKEGGLTASKLDYVSLVQELKKPGSGDKAAIIITSLSAPGAFRGAEIDVRFLVAPGGDVQRTKEMRFDHATGSVVPTNSFWTRFKGCMTGTCSVVCTGALTTCAFTTWAGYLQCLAVACGGCSAKCFACATCKCRWWCKWAAGCCRD